MAYNFYAEGSGEPDWLGLREAAARAAPVEAFPIPGADVFAIGVSVPGRAANPSTWPHLTRLLSDLRSQFGMTVYELYTGQEVTDATLPQIRDRLLG